MGRDTRDAILESAIALFARKGFNAATTLEIAQGAGVAEVTVFRHFKTKKEILLAVFDRFLGSFGQTLVLDPIRTILERHGGEDRQTLLRLVVRDRIALLQKNSDILWIVLTESKYHSDLKEKIVESLGAEVGRLVQALFPPSDDPERAPPGRNEAVLRAFIGTVLALVLQYELLGKVLPAGKPLDEAIDDALDILLHGIE